MAIHIDYTREYARSEFTKSGEILLLKKLQNQLPVIFDVGSNIGEWATLCREINPDSEIHSFEVVPETYRRYLENVQLDAKIIPNGFGLSDQAGTISIKHSVDFPVLSSSLSDLYVGDNFEYRTCLVQTGDIYCESRRIDYIDFLKIDTEGAEGLVLKGFTRMLEEQRIGLIQFEYGFANVVSKWLLIDAYKLLEPHGFKLGLLSENNLNFKDYNLTDENFLGPNYVAVHESKVSLFR